MSLNKHRRASTAAAVGTPLEMRHIQPPTLLPRASLLGRCSQDHSWLAAIWLRENSQQAAPFTRRTSFFLPLVAEASLLR
jgi:hypothetical protein